MARTIGLVVAALAAGLLFGQSRVQAADAASAMFPFVLPWDDSTPSVIDLSGLLQKPAGKFGQVIAGQDGHLYAGNNRIRFFGVDLAFDANIPTHEQADKIAGRMAKFGINIVRFHIMDMAHFPRGILARDVKSTRDLDAEALDRLDYFTAQLNGRGIYVKLCLLNYRPINAADGLPQEIEQAGGDPFQKRHVVGFFDKQVLDLQKEYARKLLTHVNAYTKKPYTDSPGVAFVEINNENGLIHAWLSRSVDELPALYMDELKQQWNQWLLARYGSTEKLRQAWTEGEQKPGEELLKNRDFARQLDDWTFEVHEGAVATVAASDDVPQSLSGTKSARIVVTKPGTQDWHLRFQQPGFGVEAERSCTLSFWAKADKPLKLNVSIDQTKEPWHVLGGRLPVQITSEWKQYQVVLPINENDDKVRVCIDPPMEAANIWLANPSLHAGGAVGLGQDERPESNGIPALTRGDMAKRTPAVQRDWMRFLWETEDRYWQTMYHYLKDDLKVKALVIGTVVGCSTPNMMAKIDAVDSHAYWQHPQFPGRAWDSGNWFVQNIPMINERGGVLTGLALHRVLDKPFCVTEYGVCAPNTYVAEGHLLRAAYAALQDWDYISASRYSHTADWDSQRIRNYFDIDQHPTKMATMVPAAAMFLRADVSAAKELVVGELGKEQELTLLRRSNPWELVSAANVGVSAPTALVHRIAIATEGEKVPSGALTPKAGSVSGDRFISDTNQLDWDVREAGHGVMTVNTDRSKAVIGFGGGKHYDLGGVAIDPGPTMQDGFSVITVTAMEGDLGKGPARLLITATGSCENTDMGWKNAQKTTVGNDWGKAPSLVEGIAARITLPAPSTAVSVWSLDERGQRKSAMTPAAGADGKAVISIGPEQRTIWYEVQVK